MNAAENSQNEWMESMLGEFLDESGQLLERLDENLLQLDALVRAEVSQDQPRCDDALLNEMFRSAHSLKGLSAMLGLGDINKLTHRLENVFDAARKDGLPVTADVVELMFQAVDHLNKLVESLKDPAAEPIECEAIIEGIRQLLASHGVERMQGTQADAEQTLAKLAQPASAATISPATPLPDGGETASANGADAECDSFADVKDDAAAADKYIPIFIDDAGLSLDRLAETLLALEKGGSRESLKTVLHVAHQLKGSAAAVGLNRPAKLAHLMEDLLQQLVDSGGSLWPEAIDALLKCSDKLRQYLDNLRQGRTVPDAFGQVARELLAAQAVGMPATPVPAEHVRAAASITPASPEAAGDSALSGGRTPGISEELRRCVEAVAPAGTPCLVGQVLFQPQLPMVGLKAQLVHNKLANLGELCYFDPPAEQLDDLDVLEQVLFGLFSDKPCDVVHAQLKIGGVEHVTLETLFSDKSALDDVVPETSDAAASGTAEIVVKAAQAAASPAKPPVRPDEEQADAAARGKGAVESNRAPTETLRVDIEQLDELMNLSGQLVISKARFAQLGERLKVLRSSKRWVQTLTRLQADLGRLNAEGNRAQEQPMSEAESEAARSQARRLENELQDVCAQMQLLQGIPDSINDLCEAVHQLDRVSDAVQQAVMDTRMVPIGPLFNRFKRMIRDITRSNGKEVRLVINGEKTKLDKRMIDELGDPLIHMVRNAADHGIESPEVRAAAGKPRMGTVTLDAFHRGNFVVIEVRDDGAGLNTDRILRKCLEKGLFGEAEAQKMTPHQIHQMIWAPGLSTAEKVTEVSGRGMGMDIVKSKIDLLHGTVDLASTPGQGTLLSIKLPLTLAIQPSLLVEIEGDVFAMPMESVVEIVRVPRAKLATVHGQRTTWVRRRAISIAQLDRVFQWAGRKPHAPPRLTDDVTIVIVGEGKNELGLEVDCVLGEQDAVIKSITENYRNVAGITGASILGDGRVSLILDVVALIQMAAARPAATTQWEETL